MGSVIYALCALTSLVCFGLLLRGYAGSKARLLLWSSLCFFFLAIQNVILFIDMALVPQVNLSLWRTLAGFIGCITLLLALIWEYK